jgi:photosystem II stability/assembly factor-like uncharacterized protein
MRTVKPVMRFVVGSALSLPTPWSTRDGGATWAKLSPRGIADEGCKTGPAMIDAQRAFLGASGAASASAIYRTIDGGAIWAAATLPDPPATATSRCS